MADTLVKELPGTTPHGKWIFGIFSEADGTASFGRVGSFIALVVAIAWVSYLVYHNHMLPGLGDTSLFIGTPYALNKTAQAVSSFGNGQKTGG
jgi:hypothetical protein